MIRRPAMIALALAGVGFLAGCDGCNKNRVDATPTNTDPDAAPVNVAPIPTASVAKMVNPAGLPAYTGEVGSVEGVVTVVGLPATSTPGSFDKCPEAADTWGKAFREGENRALADVVVAVTGYEGFYIPEKSEAETVTIRDCALGVRTVTMTFGQRLDVKNETKDFWTPILLPGSNMVLRMATPGGDPVRLYPKAPGHYILSDRDRSFVQVDVYAFLHPLHTATDREGRYRIDGLPVGKMKINARHPRIDFEINQDFEVKPGVVQRVDFVIRHETPDAGRTYDAGATTPAPVIH